MLIDPRIRKCVRGSVHGLGSTYTDAHFSFVGVWCHSCVEMRWWWYFVGSPLLPELFAGCVEVEVVSDPLILEISGTLCRADDAVGAHVDLLEGLILSDDSLREVLVEVDDLEVFPVVFVMV